MIVAPTPPSICLLPFLQRAAMGKTLRPSMYNIEQDCDIVALLLRPSSLFRFRLGSSLPLSDLTGLGLLHPDHLVAVEQTQWVKGLLHL